MKTLLQINSVVNSGSTGRIAEGIGQVAMENGWKSYIAYGRNKRESQSNLIKIGSEKDIILHGPGNKSIRQARSCPKKSYQRVNKVFILNKKV